MPFYEYQCSACGAQVEILQKITDAPLKKCPECGRSKLAKLVSAPVFRLKGGGWYETDFKTDKDARRNLVETEKSESAAGDKPAEKADVMAAFKNRLIQLLVATTVIEVGVDVPNATLMVIEHAERMGLAQLHQLRGRVGRGSQQSLAILLYYQPLSEMARARLKVIYESHDGFEIARQDLLQRGPGEFLGARQSGAPLLRFADLEKDVDLIESARQVADELLGANSPAVIRHLDRWLGSRQF